MFTVGGFARIGGVSAKVLRAWDAAGLFAPAWVDPSSGYRYYSPAQLPDLRRILALRDVGVGLAEIGALVGGGADLRATLERRRAALEDERREVERRLAALEIRVALGADGTPEPDVVIRRLPAELVATFDLVNAPGDDIGSAFHELEVHVRDRAARAHRPPGAIADENLIFVPLRRAIAATERIGVRRLPAERVASILHRGPYATLPAARTAMGDWATRAGHPTAGPLRIVYLQFGAEADLRLPRAWTVERDADFVTELQLPIEG
jgi:DNA-binding transcriptional MerR regulator